MENRKMRNFLNVSRNLLVLVMKNKREEIELRRALLPESVISRFVYENG